LAREALTKAGGKPHAAAFGVIAAVLSLAPLVAFAARHHARSSPPPAPRMIPYPRLPWPVEISGSQYAPVAWTDIPGWNADDHLEAYKAFRTSCKSISAQQAAPADPKALGGSLRDPCHRAKAADVSDAAKARAFFEENFLKIPAAFLGVMAPAVVDEDAAHQLCCDTQELLPVLPTNFSLIGEAEIGLMHQSGCLQGVIAALPPQVTGRQTPQFRVEQHDQFGHCLVIFIAEVEFTEKGGYIDWRIHKSLERDQRTSGILKRRRRYKDINEGESDLSSRTFPTHPKDRAL